MRTIGKNFVFIFHCPIPDWNRGPPSKKTLSHSLFHPGCISAQVWPRNCIKIALGYYNPACVATQTHTHTHIHTDEIIEYQIKRVLSTVLNVC